MEAWNSSRNKIAENILYLHCHFYGKYMEDDDDDDTNLKRIGEIADYFGYVIKEDPDVSDLWYILRDRKCVCSMHTTDDSCSYEYAGLEQED